MKERKIGASWFITHGYCEYKLYLQKVLGIEPPKTQEMIIGSEIHEEKEKAFLEKAEEGTWEEFLKAEELTITKEVFFEQKVGDIILLGKVDEIAVDKDSIRIIDDKPKAFPYIGTKNQILAYCYLFREQFKPLEKKLSAALRNRDTNQIVWEQEFNKSSEEQFFTAFHRLRNILLEKEEPIPTKNQNKCRACQFNKMCKHSLAKT